MKDKKQNIIYINDNSNSIKCCSINLSVGYYNQHKGNREFLKGNELILTHHRVIEMVKEYRKFYSVLMKNFFYLNKLNFYYIATLL